MRKNFFIGMFVYTKTGSFWRAEVVSDEGVIVGELKYSYHNGYSKEGILEGLLTNDILDALLKGVHMEANFNGLPARFFVAEAGNFQQDGIEERSPRSSRLWEHIIWLLKNSNGPCPLLEKGHQRKSVRCPLFVTCGRHPGCSLPLVQRGEEQVPAASVLWTM